MTAATMPDRQPRSVAVAAENLLAVTGQSPMATDGWDLNNRSYAVTGRKG